MNAQCLISFGSNLGQRGTVLAEAAARIARSPLVNQLTASRLYTTPPIGGPGGQEPFLNAVAAFETNASAREILAMLQETETDLGRQRQHRWGARSIDLDVVLHGELVGGGTGLIVPHPRYTARQFVLQPACDVAGHYRDPRFGWTLKQLAEHVSAGAPSLALIGGDVVTRTILCRRLTHEHGIRSFAAPAMAEPMTIVGNAPAVTRNESHGRSATHEPVEKAGPEFQASGGKQANQGSRSGSAKRMAASGDPGNQPAASITVDGDEPWVSAFVPPLPALDGDQVSRRDVPRLLARIQQTTPQTRWPAPHQMWPSGWRWPEYRLEVDDLDWAVGELASALDSMRCPCSPATEDGCWWQ